MKRFGWPTGPHMASVLLYGVQILSLWTLLHVGLMLERFGSINTSMSIPTFHSAVIRIQGRWAQRILQCAGHCEQTIGDKAGSAVAEPACPGKSKRILIEGVTIK